LKDQESILFWHKTWCRFNHFSRKYLRPQTGQTKNQDDKSTGKK